jgi:glycosyltransferase involved in cell wall biosynthesis
MHQVRRVPDELIEGVPLHTGGTARQGEPSARMRVLLGWSEDEFVFCAITKLGPERGNETLIEAFKRCRAAVPNARLVFVYKPTLYHRIPKEYENIDWIRDADAMRDRMHRLIGEAGVQDSVTLVESLDAPDDYYAATCSAPFEGVRFLGQLIEGMAHDARASSRVSAGRWIHATWGAGYRGEARRYAAMNGGDEHGWRRIVIARELGGARAASQHFDRRHRRAIDRDLLRSGARHPAGAAG